MSTFTVDDVGTGGDVDGLLEVLYRKMTLPRSLVWLSYAGKPLEFGVPLAHYSITAGSTVLLAMRGRGGVATFRMHPPRPVAIASSRSVRDMVAALETPSGTVSSLAHTPQQQTQTSADAMQSEVRRALSALDEKLLIKVLAAGDIRLLRVEWLLAQPEGFKMERRQDLEARESKGELPLLWPSEAVALVREGNRSVGALSYGWSHCLDSTSPCSDVSCYVMFMYLLLRASLQLLTFPGPRVHA